MFQCNKEVLFQVIAQQANRGADAFLCNSLVAGEVHRGGMHNDNIAFSTVRAGHQRCGALFGSSQAKAAIQAGGFCAVSAVNSQRVFRDLRHIWVVHPLPLHPVAEGIQQFAFQNLANLLGVQALLAAVVFHLIHAQLLPAADAVRYFVEHILGKDNAVALPLMPVDGVDISSKIFILFTGDTDAFVAAHQQYHLGCITVAQLHNACTPLAVAFARKTEEIGRCHVEFIFRSAVIKTAERIVGRQGNLVKGSIPHSGASPTGTQLRNISMILLAQPFTPVLQLVRVVRRTAGRPRRTAGVRRLVDNIHLYIGKCAEFAEETAQHTATFFLHFGIVQCAAAVIPVVHFHIAQYKLHGQAMAQRSVEGRFHCADCTLGNFTVLAIEYQCFFPHAGTQQVEALFCDFTHIHIAQPGVHMQEAAAEDIRDKIGGSMYRCRNAALCMEFGGNC